MDWKLLGCQQLYQIKQKSHLLTGAGVWRYFVGFKKKNLPKQKSVTSHWLGFPGSEIPFINWSHLICEKINLDLTILEKEMAAHSSMLAWKIPWTEDPGWATVYGIAESDMTEQPSSRDYICKNEGNFREQEMFQWISKSNSV